MKKILLFIPFTVFFTCISNAYVTQHKKEREKNGIPLKAAYVDDSEDAMPAPYLTVPAFHLIILLIPFSEQNIRQKIQK